MEEITLSQKMNAIFNSSMSVVFQNEIRRKDGEWYTRITWTHVGLPGNNVIKTCEWWGFETMDEAADDCLNYIVINSL